jgi:hypothetical protein
MYLPEPVSPSEAEVVWASIVDAEMHNSSGQVARRNAQFIGTSGATRVAAVPVASQRHRHRSRRGGTAPSRVSRFFAQAKAEARAKRVAGYQPAEEVRYNQRSSAERVNGNLKDNCGAHHLRVRGAPKVFCHLMFGIVVVSVEQIMRLVT